MSIEHAMNKKLQIHNSTAEFLIFQIENKEEGIEVLYQDESLLADAGCYCRIVR